MDDRKRAISGPQSYERAIDFMRQFNEGTLTLEEFLERCPCIKDVEEEVRRLKQERGLEVSRYPDGKLDMR